MPNSLSWQRGKVVVQDWDVIQTWDDEPLLYILTRQQAAALVAVSPDMKWLTRWNNAPDKDTLDAFVAEMMFNLMNPITCAMLNACLADAFAAQTTTILTNITNLNNFGTMTPGLPLTTEQREENLAGTSNPGCNFDILWAQCLAIVDYTNESIVDTLQKVEAATNLNELAGLSGEIPLVGWVLEFFGEELATETINYFQEAIEETYNAQYTEAVRYELACALFCLGMSDCAISVDTVYNLLFERVESIVPDNPAAMIDLIEMLAGIDFDGTNVVDLMFWFCWGGVKLASFAVGEPVTTAAFMFLLALAVDDASPDWLLRCDCGSDWNYELDSTTDPVWVTFPNWGGIGGNVVFQTTNAAPFGFDVTGINILIEFPTTQHLTGIRVNALETVGVESAGVVNRFWAFLDSGDAVIASGDLPIVDDPWEVFLPVDTTGVKKVVIQYLFVGAVQEMTWQPVQLFGFGVNPFV